MLQLVLGHLIPPGNYQDIATTRLLPRGFCITTIPGRPATLDTRLTLANHGPNIPSYYDLLPFGPIVGSINLLMINYRADAVPPDNQMTGTVQIRNFGRGIRQIQVYGIGVNARCTYDSFTVDPGIPGLVGTLAKFSWSIVSGYTYYLKLLN
jgi:hypothetical protein